MFHSVNKIQIWVYQSLEGGRTKSWLMALTTNILRPHHVRSEAGGKREDSNLLIWELVYPGLFASYFLSVALLSPVSAWCPMREEFIAFIADTTLVSFRAGPSPGEERGCDILAVHWPGCAQRLASGSVKPQAPWVEVGCRAGPQSPWPWQSCAPCQICANQSKINHMPAQEFKVRPCFPWFTCNTKGSKLPSRKT